MKKKKPDDRGRIEIIKLSKPIYLNGEWIDDATIEIDHINYGLNKKTKKLNKRKRTEFTIKDVEKFLALLDEEDLCPLKYDDLWSVFALRVNCPIKGKFFDREFMMFFRTHYKKRSEIYTITIFPSW